VQSVSWNVGAGLLALTVKAWLENDERQSALDLVDEMLVVSRDDFFGYELTGGFDQSNGSWRA